MQRSPTQCLSLRCRGAMFGATPSSRRIAAGPIHLQAPFRAQHSVPIASLRQAPQSRWAFSTTSSSSSQLRSQPAGLSSGVSPTDVDNPDAASRPLEIPSNIPREDYATPAMYSFGIMARAFRYAVFGSVAVALGGTLVYLSTHAYVEYISLNGWAPLSIQDAEAFSGRELLPPFSGAHRGGGTEPSLGWRARNSARAAYIALHVSQGGLASGHSGVYGDVAVPDKSYLDAETYLVYALAKTEGCAEPNAPYSDARAQARWELLEKLAEVRSKLAGARGLGDARRNYQELVLELEDSKAPADAMEEGQRMARILVNRVRLAEIENRLANEILSRRSPPEAVRAQSDKALEKMQEALQEALGAAPAHSQQAHAEPEVVVRTAGDTTIVAASQQPTKAKTGWLPWRSDTGMSDELAPSSASARTHGSSSTILASYLPSLSTTTSPSLQRSVVTSILTLIPALTASGSLQAARQIAQTTLASLDALEQRGSIGRAGADESHELHRSWLRARQATLLAYDAEIGYGLDSNAASATRSDASLNAALSTCDSILSSLPDVPKLAFGKAAAKYDLLVDQIYQSARRTAASAAYTRALLADATPRVALEHYERALGYLPAKIDKGEASEEAAMKTLITEGVRRSRERLTKA